jgi:hypothetical protein
LVDQLGQPLVFPEELVVVFDNQFGFILEVVDFLAFHFEDVDLLD